MSTENVTPIGVGAPSLTELDDSFYELRHELIASRQALRCASVTLNAVALNAAGAAGENEAAEALLERCVDEIEVFEDRLERWYMERVMPRKKP